jgi:hypothetical protein
VVSTKTGHIFEKRLITKYIEAEGKCPITGEPLELTDLLDVQANRVSLISLQNALRKGRLCFCVVGVLEAYCTRCVAPAGCEAKASLCYKHSRTVGVDAE